MTILQAKMARKLLIIDYLRPGNGGGTPHAYYWIVSVQKPFKGGEEKKRSNIRAMKD
jgi:hypothetical protein